MRAEWDFVYVLPHKPKKRQQDGSRPHMIDEWFIPEVTDTVQTILSRWNIGAVLANYAWFSQHLEKVPPSIIKYIDSHDRFADRHEKLRADGIAPSWFSTTKKEEAKGFARADRIFAIQEEEAAVFESYCPVPVDVVGHFLDAQFIDRPYGATKGQKLKAGFMASDNAINRRTMADLCSALKEFPELDSVYDFHIAGAICSCEETAHPAFIKHGFVADQAAFYADMDLVLNPNMGGSGLKIKSVEALGFGRPLIATKDAMIGIPTTHRLHQVPDMQSFCKALSEIAGDPSILSGLNAAGRQEFLAYQEKQRSTLRRLFPQDDTSDDTTGKAHG
ncbi:hypothetical protein GCM10017044_11220 [Kordiimonas sediminis]|uniref:Glycosyltransferase n=2 Tax=Kordiimonas sediminis TaxID=1735581 RepID=A0A919AQD5_9PROT|nr:hypothetical protein GCM10017044_11220 [Kordiimonas sediminis]